MVIGPDPEIVIIPTVVMVKPVIVHVGARAVAGIIISGTAAEQERRAEDGDCQAHRRGHECGASGKPPRGPYPSELCAELNTRGSILHNVGFERRFLLHRGTLAGARPERLFHLPLPARRSSCPFRSVKFAYDRAGSCSPNTCDRATRRFRKISRSTGIGAGCVEKGWRPVLVPMRSNSLARKTMLSAIVASTGAVGTSTKPSVAAANVTEWAIVGLHQPRVAATSAAGIAASLHRSEQSSQGSDQLRHACALKATVIGYSLAGCGSERI